MKADWKTDIITAIKLASIVGIIALAANFIRTPILFAMADSGIITPAYANMHKGLNLIDSWKHRGWPGVVTVDDGNKSESDQPRIIEITLEEAKVLFDEGECQFIDAREPEFYEEGHIPGAINWPYNAFDENLKKYDDIITPDMCVVCYCSGETCDESFVLAQSLMYSGYQNIKLFKGGMDEWNSMYYPVQEGSDP